MKKILNILLMICILTVAIVGCSNGADLSNDNLNEDEYLNIVQPNEVIEMIEDGKSFAVVIGSDTCPACLYYKKNLKELKGHENIIINYINLSQDIDMEEVQDLVENVLKQDVSKGLSTPTTYFVVNGQLEDLVIGAISTDELIEYYSDYIK